jgi:hypothetical protein
MLVPMKARTLTTALLAALRRPAAVVGELTAKNCRLYFEARRQR